MKRIPFIIVTFFFALIGIIPLLQCFGNYAGGGCNGLYGVVVLFSEIILFPIAWLLSIYAYKIFIKLFSLVPIRRQLYAITYPLLAFILYQFVAIFYPHYESWLRQKHITYDIQFKEAINSGITHEVYKEEKYQLVVNILNSSNKTFTNNNIKVGYTCDFDYSENTAVIQNVQLLPGLNSFPVSVPVPINTINHFEARIQDNSICRKGHGITVEVNNISRYPDTGIILPQKHRVYVHKDFPSLIINNLFIN